MRGLLVLGQTALTRPVATDFDSVVAGLADAFPSANDVAGTVSAIADTFGFPVVPTRGYADPLDDVYLLDVSPGVVGLRHLQPSFGVKDTAWRDDPTVPRSLFDLQFQDVEKLPTGPRSVITEWSKPSRARMVKKVGSLDYSDWSNSEGTLALMTLTLPGDWWPLVPTGKDFKQMLRILRLRWTRAGIPWRGLWKLEFQERGAPHLHALMRVPGLVGSGPTAQRFEEWIAHTWVDVVQPDNHYCHRCACYVTGRGSLPLAVGGAVLLRFTDKCTCNPGKADTDRSRMLAFHRPSYDRPNGVLDFSGVNFSDPKRTAVYFLKHSSKTQDDKEYQHIVPRPWREPGSGPGRFWGVWGLDDATATVQVDRVSFFRARRSLRALTRARASAQSLLMYEHGTMTYDQYAGKSSAFRRWRHSDAPSGDVGESARRLALESAGSIRRRFLSDHRHGGWALVNDGQHVGVSVAAATSGPLCTCLDTPHTGTSSHLAASDTFGHQSGGGRDLRGVYGGVKVSRLERYDATAGILRVDLPRSSVCAKCYPGGRSQRLVKSLRLVAG